MFAKAWVKLLMRVRKLAAAVHATHVEMRSVVV